MVARRLSPSTASNPEPPLPLRVDEAKLDFGEVWEASEFTFEFPVENFSDAAVRVTGWERSCTCLAAEPAQFTVGPGQKQTVRVKIVLTPKVSELSAGQTIRAFATSLQAKCDGKPVSPNWTLRGKVRSLFRTAPHSIDFGVVSDLARGPVESSFEIAPSVPLSSLTGVLDPPLGTVNIKTAGENYAGRITLHLPVTLGEKATLKLHAVGAAGEKLPLHEVPVTIKGATDVQPRHPKLMFGVQTVGETASGEFEFYSLTGSSFATEPAKKLQRGVIVRPRLGERNVFDVSVPIHEGSQSIQVDFLVRQPNRVEYQVPVVFVYHGK